jgi:uncharacterized protein YjiS (DUF1127 family)
MAHATTYDLGAPGFGGVAGWIAGVQKSLADYRRFRRTVEELDALSDRELADLDIARFAIRDVARDSVYGA